MKSITKRTSKLIKTFALFAVLLSVTLTALVGCSDDSDDNSSASSVEGSESSASAEISAQESSQESSDASNVSGNEDSSGIDNSIGVSESSGTESSDMSEDSSVPEDTSGTSEPSDESSQPDQSEDPSDDKIGEGSESLPYMEIPTSDMTVTTVDIAGGKSVFYGIYRVGGMYLTINDADAYVVYEGTRYDAKNGKVTFNISNALASEAIIFEIGNNGSSEKSFLISFTNPTGSYANPTVLDSIEDETTVSLEAGNSIGHYYKYIAEKDGTIRFYMTASTDSVLLATNNRNSAQRTTEGDLLTDENGKEYIELEVQKGDEIIINVGAKPKRNKYPAADITWSGKYN